MGEHNSFLNDTNLSQLAQTLPQATSTVLQTQPRTRSYPEHSKDIVRTLFDDKEGDCASRSSLGLLSSGYLDRSLLSGVNMSTGSLVSEVEEATHMKGNKKPSQKVGHTDLLDLIGASKERLVSAVFKDRKTTPHPEGSSKTASLKQPARSEAREHKTAAKDRQSHQQESLKDQNGFMSEASLVSESPSVASGQPGKHPFDDASQMSYSEFYHVGEAKEDSDAAPDGESRQVLVKNPFRVSELNFSVQEKFGLDNETFVSADDAASMMAEGERDYNEQHRFEITEGAPAAGPLGEVEIGEGDVSYPSFVTVDDNERITISAYLKSRSTPIERILGHPPTSDFSAFEEQCKASSGSPGQSIEELVEKKHGGLGNPSLANSQDASSTSSKDNSHSSGTQTKEHSFKRPLATAPRARSSQIPMAHSSLVRGSSPGAANKSTKSQKELSQLAFSSEEKPPYSGGTQITPLSPHSSKQTTHAKQHEDKPSVGKIVTPKPFRETSPSNRAGKDSGNQSHAEKTKASPFEHRTSGNLSRSSSLDLKRGPDDLSLGLGQSLCKSDGNFSTPEEKGADAAFQRSTSLEGLFASPAGTPMALVPSQHLSDSSKMSYHTARSSCQSWAVPRGLLLPVEAIQGPCKLDLGLVCAGVAHDVAVALLNPTSKSLRYEIWQRGVRIGGRYHKQTDTVRLLFPGPYTVPAGCIYEAKGTFLSLGPGVVDVEAGAVLMDEAGDTSVHWVALGAHVVWPRVSVEPEHGRLSFGGLLFGEQRQTHCQELVVANKSACPVPVILAVAGGEGTFTVRLKRESGGAKQRPALSVSTVLPCMREGPAAGTVFIVECSGLFAKGLSVAARIEVLLDGSLPVREVLAVVEASATFTPPELALEGIATGQPVYVSGDGKTSTKVVLRNPSSYPVDVELATSPFFHVSPERAMVEAQGCVQLSLRSIRPFDGPPARVTGPRVLEAVLLPQGYRFVLAELVAVPSQQPASPEMVVVPPRHRQTAAVAAAAATAAATNAGGDGHFRALESTRRVLLWTATHNGPNATKKFELRNPNPGSVIVELTLSGQGKSYFLVKMLGSGGRVSTLNGKTAGTRLGAGETMGVQVTHDPSGGPDNEGADSPPRWAHARLHIRSRCTSAVDTKSVGLYALGGRLRVDLHGVLNYREHCHLLDIGPPLPAGATARQRITVFNSGDWTACVCIETGPGATGRGKLMASPTSFVLGCQESKLVSFLYKFEDPGPRGKDRDPILPLHSIRVLYGYEVLRHRAKRAFARPDCRREPSELMLPFLNMFEDENDDAQVAVSDHLAEEVFLRSVSQMTVAVLSSDATASFLHTSEAASFAALEDT